MILGFKEDFQYKARLFSFILPVALFLLIGIQTKADESIIATEDILQNPAAIKTADMLKFLGQDEGDEAWNLTVSLVEQLRDDPVNFSPPCMQETAGIMNQKINELLESSPWLKPGDHQGLTDFSKHLDELKNNNFPYRKSVTACFICASLLQLYYEKVPAFQEQQRCREKRDLNALRGWENKTIKDMLEKMLTLYQQKEDTPDSDIKVLDYISDEFHVSYQNQNSSYLLMLNKLFQSNRVFWPIFSPLTVDDLNFMHHLPLAPVGFLLNRSEIHDGIAMKCGHFPYHDLDHEFEDVCSSLPEDLNERNAKKRQHHQVQDIYHNFRTENPDSPLFPGIRLTLFGSMHEQGYPVDKLGSPDKDSFLRQYGETVKILGYTRHSLRPDGALQDILTDFSTVKENLNLVQTGLWWCAYYADTGGYQAQQCVGNDIGKINFTSVSQTVNQNTAKLKDQVALYKQLNEETRTRILNRLNEPDYLCYWDCSQDIESLYSDDNYLWQQNTRLCFFFLHTPPEIEALLAQQGEEDSAHLAGKKHEDSSPVARRASPFSSQK